MTVAELIQRLSAFPSDMPVRFTADMGFIFNDDPTFEVADVEVIDRFNDDGTEFAIPTLHIEIN